MLSTCSLSPSGHYTIQVGFTAEGEIKGLDLALYNNAGNSLDLSSSIMDRALLHTDNSYRLGAVRAVGHCCFTHQASNTAFRGFGGPQVCFRASDHLRCCAWLCRTCDTISLCAGCHLLISFPM